MTHKKEQQIKIAGEFKPTVDCLCATRRGFVAVYLRVNELTELEIFAEENPPKRVNRPEACGLRHLAFCVESVEQTVKDLATVGIECEPIRVDDYTGKKMTFFHDPDGLPLELHE